MKKILSMTILLMIIISSSVYAENDVDPFKAAQEFYGEAIEASLQKVDTEINEEEIYIVEMVYYDDIEKLDSNIHVHTYAIVIPEVLTEDAYAYWFEEDSMVEIKNYKNFPSFQTLEFSKSEMEEYLIKNGLSSPSMVTVMWQMDHQIFAYYIRYDDISYIIPFGKTPDYRYEVLGDNEVLEFGKAYTKKEYFDVCEEDIRLYKNYRVELEKESSKNQMYDTIIDGAEVTFYVDENGETHRLTDEEREEKVKEQEEKAEEAKNNTEKKQKSDNEEEDDEEDDEELDVPTPKPVKKENEEGKEITLKTDEIIFFDVPSNHYAYSEIKEFSKRGIVNGYGNGYFGAEDSITYEHFGLLLDRLFDYNPDNTEAFPAVREDIIVSVVKAIGIDVSASDENVISESFTDCDNIRDENKKYIAGAIENGIVVGSDGKLFPDKELTRAETVVLLQRAVNYNR